MTSAMTTPAERKCIRGSGMSASSEKSQELCHILLPEREIHTEIFTEILLLINKDEKNFDAPPSSSIICQQPSNSPFTSILRTANLRFNNA